jgi:hypothetical protein
MVWRFCLGKNKNWLHYLQLFFGSIFQALNLALLDELSYVNIKIIKAVFSFGWHYFFCGFNVF